MQTTEHEGKEIKAKYPQMGEQHTEHHKDCSTQGVSQVGKSDRLFMKQKETSKTKEKEEKKKHRRSTKEKRKKREEETTAAVCTEK